MRKRNRLETFVSREKNSHYAQAAGRTFNRQTAMGDQNENGIYHFQPDDGFGPDWRL